MRWLTAVVGALVLALAGAGDRNVLPPPMRAFASPSGSFVLEVRALDAWQSPRAHAELIAVADGGRRSVWAADLRHRYGPGTAFVSDAGRVLLIDEWMRVLSEDALVLYDPTGRQVARHPVADIEAVSGVSRADLAQSARSGPWMSAPPTLLPGGSAVRVEAGGVRLSVDFDTGRLARLP
jgi:hypothetical protein